ncbi:hypothetical protein K474DRAFT_1678277 [Panus rudis PR-1116 ss-1]|nr:hypothetical protein K474DRAFT_1678277 [Panus rudis PR-1116 ss-1]
MTHEERAIDRCPAEIWARIFSFACTDGGYTGRSLSLVSRYFRDASLRVKLQSISLHGIDNASGFIEMYQRTSPHESPVQYLYFTYKPARRSRPSTFSAHDCSSVEEILRALLSYDLTPQEEDILRGRIVSHPVIGSQYVSTQATFKHQVCSVLGRLLSLTATSLRSLSLVLPQGMNIPTPLWKTSLPHLEQLSIYGCMMPSFSKPELPQNAEPLFPSLRFLHLTYCEHHLLLFTSSSPSLTHLRLSAVSKLADEIINPLMAHVSGDSDYQAAEREAPFPPSLRRIILQPNTAVQMFSGLRTFPPWIQQLRKADKRDIVHIIPGRPRGTSRSGALGPSIYDEQDVERDWIECMEGGLGCWKYDDVRIAGPSMV